MNNLLFAAYSLAHLTLCIWALQLWRHDRAPAAPILALLSGGLVYDNAMIALGSTIGIGPLLETLSWPRFILHAIVTPVLLIATMALARGAGFAWADAFRWKNFVYAVTALMVVYGIVYDLLPLELQPACFNGVVRYTSSASPSQFCFPDQVSNPGVGPPLPSIIGVFMIIGVGIAAWRRHGWPWLFAGGALMFVAAALPTSRFGLNFGNGGEVILQAAMIATAAFFAGRAKAA